MHARLRERLTREEAHGRRALELVEANWGWNTSAGQIRHRRRLEFLTAHRLSSVSSLNVLEVGCGTGLFTRGLSAHFPRLTAIDISGDLISVARSRCPSVTFEKRDAHATGFPDAHFDLVIGCSVLHHLEWDLALAEIRRILKPGGELRFCEPNLLNPQIYLQKNWRWLKIRMGDSPDEYAFTPAQITGSLRRLSFSRVEVTPFEFLHPSTPPALIGAIEALESCLEKTPLQRFGGSIRISAGRPTES